MKRYNICIIVGFIAYLANGISICIKFGLDRHALLIGFIPAISCFVLLRAKPKHSKYIHKISEIASITGAFSLISHLIFCELIIVNIPYLNFTLSGIFKLACYGIIGSAISLIISKIYVLYSKENNL